MKAAEEADGASFLDADAMELRKRAVERYWSIWPQQRDSALRKYEKWTKQLRKRLKISPENGTLTPGEFLARVRHIASIDGRTDVILPTGETLDPRTRFDLLWWTLAEFSESGGALAMELLESNPYPIATPDELQQIVDASDDELKAWPPVYASDNDEEADSLIVGVAGEDQFVVRLKDFPSFEAFFVRAQEVYPLSHAQGAYRSDVRALFHQFRKEFWAWYTSERAAVDISGTLPKRSKLDPVFSQILAQPTFTEVKQLSRSFAHAPHNIGWEALLNEFALVHREDGSRHNVRIEGSLIPEWWGRPKDSDSLMAELRATGQTGQAVLYNAIALVVNSTEPFVDADIDELITRIGLDPRSKKERQECRLQVWRILTIIGAARVVGARRKGVYDRVTGKTVQLESQDPLLTVTPWKPAGTQEAFDSGVAPLRISMYAGPFLAQYRGDRRVLQDCGNLLAVSSIAAGKPSGAWARAIGFALNQLWREQATRADYRRAGDNGQATAAFQPFTRQQLLELFPPEPSLHTVLSGNDPQRAITYWDAAIDILRTGKAKIIAHCAGVDEPLRDWSKSRPRKGWAPLWLSERLDVRPIAGQIEALQQIATAAKRKRQRRGGPEPQGR